VLQAGRNLLATGFTFNGGNEDDEQIFGEPSGAKEQVLADA
jgi:hypothetical protein